MPADSRRKVLYIDMDGVLVDFQSGIDRLDDTTRAEYQGRLDDVPGIFAKMDPIPGAIDAYHRLAEAFDVYILSTAPWDNPSAWQHKIEWVHKNLGIDEGTPAYKRLILSHNKGLNQGDYLIDDRDKNGVKGFQGEHIHFGTGDFPGWDAVLGYLLPRA
jgi:5'-nucleotidase